MIVLELLTAELLNKWLKRHRGRFFYHFVIRLENGLSKQRNKTLLDNPFYQYCLENIHDY